VIYPCQNHHASPVTPSGFAAIDISANPHADAAPRDSSPAHEDGTCQELTAPAIGSAVAAAAGGGVLDPVPPGLTALEPTQIFPSVLALATAPSAHPPPHIPLYLSTQRLLI
jgi:hypothetical protein